MRVFSSASWVDLRSSNRRVNGPGDCDIWDAASLTSLDHACVCVYIFIYFVCFHVSSSQLRASGPGGGSVPGDLVPHADRRQAPPRVRPHASGPRPAVGAGAGPPRHRGTGGPPPLGPRPPGSVLQGSYGHGEPGKIPKVLEMFYIHLR